MTADTTITDSHDADDHDSPAGTLHTDQVPRRLRLDVHQDRRRADDPDRPPRSPSATSDIGKFMVPILLVMMAVKFFTVVLYFMHLKYDNPLFKRLFYSGLFLAIFVYIVALLTFHYFE